MTNFTKHSIWGVQNIVGISRAKSFRAFVLLSMFLLASTIFLKLQVEAPMADAKNKMSHLEGIDPDKIDWRAKDDAYWKSVLTDDQFEICRSAGTERPFTGKYCSFKLSGMYRCACCGRLLFDADTKFDSGTGWPSFNQAVDDGALNLIRDDAHGMVRTEVRCARCDAHLGHVFDDGPPPTGKRFCINSVCLLHEEPKNKAPKK